MIIVIMRMKVISEKRLELLQAIVSLTRTIRTNKGCRRCDFVQSLGNENELCLIEEWDTPEDFRVHLKSEHFKVLRGAMNLLQEPCDERFYTVLHSDAMVENGRSVSVSVEKAMDKERENAMSVKGVKSVKNDLIDLIVK